jgi:hypothetical protein
MTEERWGAVETVFKLQKAKLMSRSECACSRYNSNSRRCYDPGKASRISQPLIFDQLLERKEFV